MQVVNGPIAGEIGMNSGINALGPGSRENLSIGRALRLCIINLGGSLPGVTLMAALGNVVARGLAFAENEKASPWEPFHVNRGFGAKESVLTLFGGEGGFRSIMYRDIVKTLEINKHRQSAVLLMGPILAKVLVEREGFTKKIALKEWLWENTKVTIEEWRNGAFGYKNNMLPNLGKPGHHPAFYADPNLALDTMVNVFPGPDSFHVIIVGDPSGGQECQVWEMSTPCSVSIDKWR